MKRLLFVLLSFMVLCVSLNAETLVVDNTSRDYIAYVPKDLGSQRPLLISCHGMNQDAAYQKGMLQIESVADTAKFVTVFPNGINKGWDISGDRDLRFMQAIIDEMVAKYDIDRNRVYISGFSMGGMFTYHAMNRMADKIAAFAPISGYPMGGGTYTSSRPVPIIHTHGTTDDVVGFSGVSGILAGWVKRNGCPTSPTIVKPYRAGHITKHTWAPGENGVEVVLLEMANKGHWISNDGGVKTGEEIWNFCKRYSLELKDPTVRITTPSGGLTYLTYGGPSEIPPLTIQATAADPDGKVVRVDFYNGKDLIHTSSAAPYTCVVEGLPKGEHQIRAVAVDDEGRTGVSQIVVKVLEPTGSYVLTNTFMSEGSVPEGWTTYDGSEKRVGFSSGYSSGSRVFNFTGEQHDFDWGLYTRNVTGEPNAGYARYADQGTSITLMLHPGNYQLYYRIANWNIPTFSPVTIAVETIEGKEVYTHSYTPTINIGNAASNSFSGTPLQSFRFDVTEKGRYVITFYTADAPWADLVVGQAALLRKGDVSVVEDMCVDSTSVRVQYYDLSGFSVDPHSSGIYVRKTTSQDGVCESRVVIIR